jgi:hypothetical protein
MPENTSKKFLLRLYVNGADFYLHQTSESLYWIKRRDGAKEFDTAAAAEGVALGILSKYAAGFEVVPAD